MNQLCGLAVTPFLKKWTHIFQFHKTEVTEVKTNEIAAERYMLWPKEVNKSIKHTTRIFRNKLLAEFPKMKKIFWHLKAVQLKQLLTLFWSHIGQRYVFGSISSHLLHVSITGAHILETKTDTLLLLLQLNIRFCTYVNSRNK